MGLHRPRQRAVCALFTLSRGRSRQGDNKGGHYYTVVRSEDMSDDAAKDQWVCINDVTIRELTTHGINQIMYPQDYPSADTMTTLLSYTRLT